MALGGSLARLSEVKPGRKMTANGGDELPLVREGESITMRIETNTDEQELVPTVPDLKSRPLTGLPPTSQPLSTSVVL